MIADFSGQPLAEGKEAVSAFYSQGVPGFLSWSQHRCMNEMIEVKGDTAAATWYFDCPVVFRAGTATGLAGPGFIGGRYQEEYIREDGVWKWKKIVALIDVQTEFATNWSEATQLFKNR